MPCILPLIRLALLGTFPTIDLKEVVEELTTYALPRLFDDK